MYLLKYYNNIYITENRNKKTIEKIKEDIKKYTSFMRGAQDSQLEAIAGIKSDLWIQFDFIRVKKAFLKYDPYLYFYKDYSEKIQLNAIKNHIKFINCNYKTKDLLYNNNNITKKYINLINNYKDLYIELQNQVSYSQPFGRVTTKKQLYYIDSIDPKKNILQLYFTDNPGFKSFLNLRFDKIFLKNNNIHLYNTYNNNDYIIKHIDNNIIKQLKNTIKSKRGNISKKIIKVNPENKKDVKTAQKTSKKTIKKAVSFNINDLNKIKKQIEKNQNIKNIDILGAWIWCETLDTTARDLLLNIGFKFSFSKLKFYYHNKPFKKRSNKTLSYERIKELYKEEVS